MTRAQMIAMHAQVEKATRELGDWFGRGQATLARLRELVDRGALTDRLPVSAWRETIQEDDLAKLGVLVEGAEHMPLNDRIERMQLVSHYGSGNAMQVLLDMGFCQSLSLALPSALREAVRSDRVDVARVLLDAGGDASMKIDNDMRQKTLVSTVCSVEMLDLLASHGARPTKEDMLLASLALDAPRPDLLARFLELGAPLGDDSSVAQPWLVNFREPYLVHANPEPFIACARVLLAAGVPRPQGRVYPLPVLLAALEAGMPAEEAHPSVRKMWDDRDISSRDFYRDRNMQPPRDEFHLLVASMITRLEDYGVDIDLTSKIGIACSGEWGKALVLAGVDAGVSFDFKAEMQAHADAARLRRASRVPRARPGPGRRL